MKNLKAFNLETDYYAWAGTIIARTAIDFLRNQTKKSNILYPLVNENISNHEASNDAINNLSATEIIELIQLLPDSKRLVFTMYEIDGFTHKEISELTGINTNTSRWILSKSRKILVEKYLSMHKFKSNYDVK